MEFLLSIVQSSLTIETIVLLACGIAGMVAHYAKKYFKGQTKVSMKDYFGKNNPLSSATTFATYSATMTGMLMGFDISTLDLSMVAILGGTLGWSIDSGVNTVKE